MGRAARARAWRRNCDVNDSQAGRTRRMFYRGQAKRDSQVRDWSFLPKSCQKCILKNMGQNCLKFHLSHIKLIACIVLQLHAVLPYSIAPRPEFVVWEPQNRHCGDDLLDPIDWLVRVALYWDCGTSTGISEIEGGTDSGEKLRVIRPSIARR